MRAIIGVAVLASVGFACGMGVCNAFTDSIPQALCRATDAGGTVVATVFADSASACRASADAGVLTLGIDGTSCSHGNNPVVFSAKVACDLSTLPAGTYTTKVSGGAQTLVLPLAADAGLADCL